MVMSFHDADQPMNFGVIPDGTLAVARLTIRSSSGQLLTRSRSGNSTYLDCELAITAGPFANRKIFERIMRESSEKAKEMGDAAIRAILESNAFFTGRDPSDPNCLDIDDYGDLQGALCAMLIKVEPAQDSAPDPVTGQIRTSKPKNRVGVWISPVAPSTARLWADLMAQGAAPAPRQQPSYPTQAAPVSQFQGPQAPAPVQGAHNIQASPAAVAGPPPGWDQARGGYRQ